MEQLQDILKREHQALVKADVAQLEQITQDKTQALQYQAQVKDRRSALAQSRGGVESSEELEALFTGFDNAQQLRAMHAAFLQLAETCNEANRANGRLIAQQQKHTVGALNVLRQTERDVPVYSGQGAAVESRTGRILGRA